MLPTDQKARWSRPSRQSFLPSLAFILYVLMFLYALTAPVYSGDVGWQIRAGQQWLESGDVPRLAFLTFTAPLHPWVAQEWGSGVVFALVDQWAGWSGLLLLRALLFAGLWGVAFRFGRWLGAEPISWSLILVPVGAVFALNTAVRPWLFSNILTLGILWLSFAIGRRGPLIWVLPPLFFVWAQLHGAWVWGAAIVAAFALQWLVRPGQGGPKRHWVVLAGLCSIGSLSLGPYGSETLFFPLRYLIRDEVSGIAIMYQQIKEWAPPEIPSFFGTLLLILGGVTGIGLFRIPHSRIALALINICFFWMALRVQRHLPLFAIVSLPVLAMAYSRPFSNLKGRFANYSQLESATRWPLFVIGTALLLVGGWQIVGDKGFVSDRLSDRGYPEDAVRCLSSRSGGHLLNHYDWGGYVVWQAPQWQVFITPIPDSYPASVFEEWLVLANVKPGAETLLGQVDVDAALFPARANVSTWLAEQPGWQMVYKDKYAAIVAKGDQAPWGCQPSD